LARPVQYVATAKFGPQGLQRNVSQFAGLAARLGFNLGGSTRMESPEFYSELLRSGHLLREIVETRYTLRQGPADTAEDTATLLEIYQVEGRTRRDSILA